MDLSSQLTPPKRRRVLEEPGGVTRVGAEENEETSQPGDGTARAEDYGRHLDVRESGHPGNHDACRKDHSGVSDASERDHPRDSGANGRDHAVNDNSRDRDCTEAFDSRESRSGGHEVELLQQKSQVYWTRAETLCEASSGQASPSERVLDLLTSKEQPLQTTTGRAEEKSPPRVEAFHHPVHRKRRHAPRERGHDLADTPYATRTGNGMRDLLGRLTVQAPTWSQNPEGSQATAYAHPYLYPLPFHSLENQGLLMAGKPFRNSAGGAHHSAHSALEDIRVPQALHQLSANYQLFAGVKLLEGHPILAPPLDPVSAREELAYSGGQGPVPPGSLEKGPALMEDSPFRAASWHLGLYPPAWSHPLHHLRSNLGASASPAPENGLSARSKESSIRRENVLQLTVNDAAPSPAKSPPAPAISCRPSDPGEARLGPDNKMAALSYSGRGLERVWRSEAQQADGRTYMPRGKTTTSDTQSYQPLRMLEPLPVASETGLVTSSDLLGVFPHHSASAFAESKELVRSQSPNQSVISDCLPGGRVSIFSQTVEGRRATIIAQGRPGIEPLRNHIQNVGPAGDFRVRGGKRSSDSHISPERTIDGKPHGTHYTGRLFETEGILENSSKGGKIVDLIGPTRNHTKMKQTWLTRHSEQFGCHAPNQGYRGSKTILKDDLVSEKGEKRMLQHTEKRPCECDSDEEPLMPPITTSKRSRVGVTEIGNDPDAVAAEPKDLNEPKCSTDTEDDQGAQRDVSVLKSVDEPQVSLQNVPCLLLPEGIERCCSCGSPDQGATTQAVCRFLHFRRLVHRNDGQMEADGLFTVDEAGDDGTKEAGSVLGKASDGPRSLSPAKYLLSTLGDQFCEIIRRDQQSLSWSQQNHEKAVAWRKDRNGLQVCDTCQGTFFNSHWSCSRCGFQMCTECHKSKQKTLARDGQGKEDLEIKCRCGPEHNLHFLVPTRFISTHVLSQMWKAMHDTRAKYDINANCHCRQTFLTDAVLLGISLSKEKEEKGSRIQTPNPIPCEEKPELKAIKEECTEPAEQTLGDQGPKEAVQSSTLCDLLTSTAVKLCLGQSGVRMAFAPVSQALPTNDRISSILDNIIAQVVERKIQEKQHLDSGDERSLSPPESSLYYPSSPQGGILWLQDPDDSSNYRRFQEHWRQCQQPVLVSGLTKNMKRSLWGPGPLGQELSEQSEPMDSKEFWDSFVGSIEIPRDDKSRGCQQRGEWSLEELRPSWIENLNSCLPLPEYCRPGGKLNLATYLPSNQLWLCPRISAAHGMKFDNRGLGTKSLAAEVTDFLNILVHIEEPDEEFCDGRTFQQEILLRTDDDSTEGLVKEQLWASRGAPGALWHIFQAEDAEQIRRFLKKVCAERPQPPVDGTTPSDRQSCYLDLSLLRRLQEECGVKSWALLQFLGDAVVVPAGSPYQVHYFSNSISVTQLFLSPENALLSVHLMRSARKTQPSTQKLSAQMEGAIFGAVKDAVETLQAYN